MAPRADGRSIADAAGRPDLGGTAARDGQADEHLLITAESDLVVFDDGIESDSLSLSWGQTARLGLAEMRLRLLG